MTDEDTVYDMYNRNPTGDDLLLRKWLKIETGNSTYQVYSKFWSWCHDVIYRIELKSWILQNASLFPYFLQIMTHDHNKSSGSETSSPMWKLMCEHIFILTVYSKIITTSDTSFTDTQHVFEHISCIFWECCCAVRWWKVRLPTESSA